MGRMNNVTGIKKAILVGFAGTVVMTVFSFVASAIHLPRVDYREMIAHLFPAGMLGSWMVYFVVGFALAFSYHTYFQEHLPSHSWMRGAFYGFFLWLIMGIVLMPLMGFGFFAGSMPNALGMFLCTMSYSATVGYLYEYA